MGWWNEPLKKWDFKFRGQSWKKYPLQLTSWTHNWDRQRMNFQKMPAKKDFCSQLLSQLSLDYPPPIWSLPSLPVTSYGFLIFHVFVFVPSTILHLFGPETDSTPVFCSFSLCISLFWILLKAYMICITETKQFWLFLCNFLHYMLILEYFQVRLCSRCLHDLWHSGNAASHVSWSRFFLWQKKQKNCIRGSFKDVLLILKTLTFKSGTSILNSYRTFHT